MNLYSKNHQVEEGIKHTAVTSPDLLAIVSSKYNSLSYSQLAWQINYVADALRESGFRKSSRIAIAIKDAAPAALAIAAVACFAAAVPLDQNLIAAETETRLKLLNVDAICVIAAENSVAKAVAEKLGILIIELIPKSRDELSFTLSVPKISRQIQSDDIQTDNVAVIFQTSGTTEEPKLVPCLHSGLSASAERVRTWFNLSKNDRCLSIASPYYSHGLTLTILAPLLSGGSVAFPSNPYDVNLVEWFETLKPTWFSASPPVHLAISEKLGATSSGLKHQLRLASSGGAKLPESVQSNLHNALGIPILEHYGMTEASQISSNLPPPGLHKSGTVGIPPPETVIVVDSEGNNLAAGQKGEIWVRGPNVTKGYLNVPDLNKAAFSNGWFRTGDIGSFDEDGFLTIHDRIKELINRGGEKISPFEVEAILLKHPDIMEAVVFALPHPRLGEDVAAAIVLRPGTTLPADEIRKFMSAYLSWNKIPRRLHVLESIPKGFSGKVLRKELRKIYS